MTSERRDLIFHWGYREWGGAQIYFLAIMKLARQSWNITVILPAASSPEIIGLLRSLAVNIILTDFYIDLGPAPTLAAKLRRQWSRIRAEILGSRELSKYDLPNSILHIETSPWQSWIYLRALLAKDAHV